MRKWMQAEWSPAEAKVLLPPVARFYAHAILLDDSANNGWHQGTLAAFGVHRQLQLRADDAPEAIHSFVTDTKDYVFGHVGYNLKASIEGVHCAHPDTDGFPAAFLFVPRIVIRIDDHVHIGYLEETDLRAFTQHAKAVNAAPVTQESLQWIHRTSRDRYLQQARSILKRIHRGDIYEINYCMEFYRDRCTIDPVATYYALKEVTLAPYGGLYRCAQSWLICGSPELFLRKTGAELISRPIKGTRRRGTSLQEDEELRNELQHDAKERSENVMIVDLVRNDLSRIATRGSVHVADLFGITSFKTVHQMSSTVVCEVKPDVSFSDILRATFPMGSMTGAPKISAMRIAEEHEDQSRGIYSGAIGYITPEGDFEFNVVIRSILWNADSGYLSVKAGSALTSRCIPEQEYEECLLKARAMMNAVCGSC